MHKIAKARPIGEPAYVVEDRASGRYDVANMAAFRSNVSGSISSTAISYHIASAFSKAKSPLTLEMSRFTPSFTCCSQLNYIATLRGRRTSSSVPVVVLRVEHRRSRKSRPRGF